MAEREKKKWYDVFRVLSFKQLPAFNSKKVKDCRPEEEKTIDRSRQVFAIFFLISIVTAPLMTVFLIYGVESTVVFKNDDKIIGIRSGRLIQPEEYPDSPFAVYKNASGVYYADKDNITVAYIQMLGFIVAELDFLTELRDDPALISSFIFIVQSLIPLITLPYGELNETYNNLVDLPVYDTMTKYSSMYSYGNIGKTHNHDVKFKISAGSYIIPIFMMSIFVDGIYNGDSLRENSVVGIWDFVIDPEESIDQCKTGRGLWEIEAGAIDYDYAAADAFINQDTSYFSEESPSIPIKFHGEIKRLFDLSAVFTPVTEYSTDPLY